MEVSRALFLMLTPVADTVITRLVRFWKARDVNKRGELMGVDTLLLDEKVCLLRRRLSKCTWLNISRHLLREGATYEISRFDVISSNTEYKQDRSTTVSASVYNAQAGQLKEKFLAVGVPKVIVATSINPKFLHGVFLWMLILGHVPTLTSKQEPVRPLLAGTMHHLTLEMLEAGLLGKKLYEAKVLVKSWLNFKELHELKRVCDDDPTITPSYFCWK
uniref:Cysteine proteinase inhibitor n=1 Tax=Brassica oleracea var. oleracea TaxID=109376 RepID=A0A0D3BHC9_BRAOL